MNLGWKAELKVRLRGNVAWDYFMRRRDRNLAARWMRAGRFGPPHIVKQQAIREYADQFGLDTLIETGTFLGDMIFAMKGRFRDIYSIELSEPLYKRACRTFSTDPSVHLVQGNSAAKLAEVLSAVSGRRCLFWLDGHYSGGFTATGEERCPLRGELAAIFKSGLSRYVLLIDDAVCFDGRDGYPTVFELNDTIHSNLPGYRVSILDNIIRVAPPSASAT